MNGSFEAGSWRALPVLVAVVAIGCSDPCRDYCETFVERTQECGLGGPSGDDAIDECGEQVGEVLNDDACENADGEISSMSCEEFVPLVCSQPDAALAYNCD